MNLIWHIVKKDLVRMRLPLALWVLLMVAKIGLGVALRAGDGVDFTWFGRIELYVNVCTWLDGLMIYILVAVLIHGDALVGTQAGWKTRPISGARLLGAKVLGTLLIFGVLPVLISLPWWLMCSFGVHEIGEAMLESIVWQALFVLPSLALAVLSENFARYFTLTLAVIFVVAVACLLQVAYLPDLGRVSLTVQESRVLVVLALVLAGLVGVVVHQFLTLRTWRSGGLGLAAIGLAMVATSVWPWDIVLHRMGPDPEVARGVSLTLERPSIDRGPNYAETKSIHILFELQAHGVPEDRVLSASVTRLSWRGADGAWLNAVGWARGGPLGLPLRRVLQIPPERVDEETHRFVALRQTEAHARDHQMPATPPVAVPGDAYLHSTVTLNAELADQLPDKLQEGELTTDLELDRPLPLLDLPLKVGLRQAKAARSVRIAKIDLSPVKVWATDRILWVVETHPLNAARWWWPIFRGDWTYGIDGGAGYWEVNRSQGMVRWLASMGMGYSVAVDGVQVTWARIGVQAPRVVRGGKWVAGQPGWVDATTLALVGFTDAVRFSRTLKVERLNEPPKLKAEPAGAP